MKHLRDRCPCCGGPMPIGPTPREELAGLVGQGDVEHGIVRRLARSPGHWVRGKDLVDAVYSDDPDGGPLNAASAIATVIARLKAQLLPHGWLLQSAAGRGHQSGYRLVLFASAPDRAPADVRRPAGAPSAREAEQ